MRGDETSFNPLGMVEALIGAMQHAAALNPAHEDADKVVTFTNDMRRVMHKLFREGKGTRDLCGPTGLTTEAFIDAAAAELDATYGK